MTSCITAPASTPSTPLPSPPPATGKVAHRIPRRLGPGPRGREQTGGTRDRSPGATGRIAGGSGTGPPEPPAASPAGAGEFGGDEEGPPRASPATSHGHVRGVEEGPPPA